MSKTIDTLAIFDEANRLYFTGKETSFGCVLVNANESFLITDFRYAGYVRDCAGFTVKIIEAPALYDTIRACLGQVGAKVVGFEDDRLSYAEYSRLKSELKGYTLSPAGAVVRAKRAVKTEEEIARIAASQVFNQTCLKKVVSQIKPGVTEREIAAQLTYEYLRAGALKVSQIDPVHDIVEPVDELRDDQRECHLHHQRRYALRAEIVLFHLFLRGDYIPMWTLWVEEE